MFAANIKQQQPAWEVRCSGRGGESLFRSEKSSLMVGSAGFCDVRLAGETPWVAYYLHRFADAAEIWPIAAQSHPRHGCLATGSSFNCGEFQLTVDYPQNGKICRAPRCWPVLDFAFRDKVARVLVNQRVTTVGSDFPSVLRLPGTALAACHLIIIWEDERLRLVAVPRPGSSAKAHMLRLKLGQQVAFLDVQIAFVGVKTSPPSAPSLPGRSDFRQLDTTQQGQKLATKLQDAFHSRHTRRDRIKYLGPVAFSVIISLLAAWFGYLLFCEVVPFL